MFDVGFMELMLIGIVALLVIGPEKLPSAVRTGALWVGRAKRSFNQVKSEIEREINADDIRRQLHNESIMADISKAKKQAEALVSSTKENLNILSNDVKNTIETEQEALQEISESVKVQANIDTSPPAAKDAPASEPTPEQNELADAPEAAKQSEATTPASSDAVEDFYNNPPKGKVMHQGGAFTSVAEPEEENAQENKQDKA